MVTTKNLELCISQAHPNSRGSVSKPTVFGRLFIAASAKLRTVLRHHFGTLRSKVKAGQLENGQTGSNRSCTIGPVPSLSLAASFGERLSATKARARWCDRKGSWRNVADLSERELLTYIQL
jgi:hypothetical protein